MIKIVDGFCWLVVNEKCAEIFSSGLFELFKLHNDGSESLIETFEELNEARVSGFDIGVEVGKLPERWFSLSFSNGTKVCLGVDTEAGNDLSWRDDSIEEWKMDDCEIKVD